MIQWLNIMIQWFTLWFNDSILWFNDSLYDSMIHSMIQRFNLIIHDQWFNFMIQWFTLWFNDSILWFNDSILRFNDSQRSRGCKGSEPSLRLAEELHRIGASFIGSMIHSMIQWFHLMIQWFTLWFNYSILWFNDSILWFNDSQRSRGSIGSEPAP
jgi:hypothetical protein